MNKTLGTLATFVVPALMAACGGGGSSAPNLQSAPGQAAIAAYYASSQSGTLNGTDASSNKYTLQYSPTPVGGTTTFEGHTAGSATRSVTITRVGGGSVNAIETVYFNLNPFALYGLQGGSGTPYAVYTSFQAVPTTITAGQNGALGAGTYYHDSTKAIVDSQFTETYAVSEDTPSSVLFCTTSVNSGTTAQGTADGLGNLSETDCYRVGSSGTAVLATITVTVNGVTLNFK
jgi:hypothetical protein